MKQVTTPKFLFSSQVAFEILLLVFIAFRIEEVVVLLLVEGQAGDGVGGTFPLPSVSAFEIGFVP